MAADDDKFTRALDDDDSAHSRASVAFLTNHRRRSTNRGVANRVAGGNDIQSDLANLYRGPDVAICLRHEPVNIVQAMSVAGRVRRTNVIKCERAI